MSDDRPHCARCGPSRSQRSLGEQAVRCLAGGGAAAWGGGEFDRRDAGEIERAVAEFGRSSNGGLIVASGAEAIQHRDLIIALAARHRLPAVYPLRIFVIAGGVMSYGINATDPYRRGPATSCSGSWECFTSRRPAIGASPASPVIGGWQRLLS